MNAIISAFLINAKDPGCSHKVGLETRDFVNPLASAPPETLYDYMRPWSDSVRNHDLDRVILHDGLSAEFQANFPEIRFELAPTSTESAWLCRFRMLADYLRRNESVDRVFFTDINDVGIIFDPFAWLDSFGINPDLPVFGEEWLRIGENRWFTSRFEILPLHVARFFRCLLMDSYPVNCGVMGGRRNVLLEVVDQMVSMFDEFSEKFSRRTEISWDMFCLNYIVFSRGPFASFKMARLARESALSGLFIRNVQGPIVHDRNQAIALTTTRREIQ